MSQCKINNTQLTGKKQTTTRWQRRKQLREKYKSVEAQTSNNTDNQSQPPNVCPEDSTNTWTPNLPPIPQDPWSQSQGTWPQPQGTWSQPEGTWPQPQGTWSQPEGTWPQPQGTWTQPEGTWPQPQGPWSHPEGTWPQPQGTWSQPEGTWPQPQGTWSQPEGTWSQPEGTWPQPQGPWSQPQGNAPNNIVNFGPTNIAGNCLPQNHIEQPLPNQNQNTFPNQSNQPKKSKKKMKIQQQPKKKLKVLSPEEQRRREAELRMIEQKYRQVVMIHRTVSASRPKTPPKKPKAKVTPKQAVAKAVAPEKKAPVAPNKPQAMVTPLKQQAPVGTAVPPQIKASTVLNKSTSQVTPSKQHGPVQIVAPPQIKIIGNTTVTPIPPGQSSQPPTTSLFATKPRKRQRSKKNKKWSYQNAVNTPQVLGNPGARSQYQAPHQDEPEDLTDDLAPNMAGGQQQPGTQPRAAAENKLNFKFQRSLPKNPDWSEYQSKFRAIGGGSPEPAEPPGAQVKQEPDHTINTGFIFEEDVEMKEVVPVHIDTSELRVAVTTESYLYLNEDQVKEINEALVNKVQDAIFSHHLSYVPTFEDIPVHNLGHLPLKCQGAKDLIWLHQTLSAIPAPRPDIKLVIRPQAAIPNMVKVKLFVPNYSGNLEELRYLLQKQNHWYDMSSWMLIKSEKQGDDPSNYSLEYRVPEKEALIIDNRDRRVAYSLGTCFAIVSDETINAEKVFKHRNVAKHLQVCVLTEPFHYLTLLEVELIKLALIYKLEKDVYSDNEYIPTFRGCPSHYKGGLKMWCESDRDLKWLKDAVNSLVSPVIGTKLTIKEQAAIPQRAKMTIVVPTTEDESFIIKVLKSQNSWCDVESWTLFSTCLDQRSDVVCVFYIPHKHIRLIKDRNCRLSFLLGYVKADITTE